MSNVNPIGSGGCRAAFIPRVAGGARPFSLIAASFLPNAGLAQGLNPVDLSQAIAWKT